MTLGFSTKINGKKTFFPQKIYQSLIDTGLNYEDMTSEQIERMGTDRNFHPKIHTIRKDSRLRWKKGNKIHSVTGNRTKKRFQFLPTFECKLVQKILIKVTDYGGIKCFRLKIDENKWLLYLFWKDDLKPCESILNKLENVEFITGFAKNDGFDSLEEFIKYFDTGEVFKGVIIHWTNKKY